MANYRGRILETVRTHAKAHIDKHLMNVEVLIGSHVGVAEHPDIIETIEKELKMAAEYQDILDMLDKFGT
jgi:hypothetical protein